MKRAFVLFALVSAGPAIAQTRAPGSAEKMAPAPAQHFVFDRGDTIEGGSASPDDPPVSGWRRRSKPSLLQMRTDFVPEMIRSVENLEL